jgi:hypothetical protein
VKSIKITDCKLNHLPSVVIYDGLAESKGASGNRRLKQLVLLWKKELKCHIKTFFIWLRIRDVDVTANIKNI